MRGRKRSKIKSRLAALSKCSHPSSSPGVDVLALFRVSCPPCQMSNGLAKAVCLSCQPTHILRGKIALIVRHQHKPSVRGIEDSPIKSSRRDRQSKQ